MTATYKSNNRALTTKVNGNHNNTSDDDDDDIYEVYIENKVVVAKHGSLTSSNRTDEATDNTAEMHSASGSSKQSNTTKQINDYTNNGHDEYEDINEDVVKSSSINFEAEDNYHDDYGLQNDEYQFIGQAPLASQSMMSSNDLSDEIELTSQATKETAEHDKLNGIQRKSTLNSLLKF